MIARSIRFLVLRGGAIGDFIATLPVLAAIRSRWPDAHVELIGYPHIARLALDGGWVDHVGSLDQARIARFFMPRPEFEETQVAHIRSFDLVISYLHDPSGLVQENLLLAGARQVIYGSPIVDENTHAVDHLLKPLETLAIYAQGAVPELPVSDAGQTWARDWLSARGISPGIPLLHAGSGSAKKNWPIDRFFLLGERMADATGQWPLYLLGEADADARRLLADRVPPERVVDGLSLLEVAYLFSQIGAYVGNDSGITHLAAAVGVPVVALFGPSRAELWAPRGPCVQVIKSISVRMEDIPFESVWDRVRAMLF